MIQNITTTIECSGNQIIKKNYIIYTLLSRFVKRVKWPLKVARANKYSAVKQNHVSYECVTERKKKNLNSFKRKK